jgi:hypothetical protein
MTDREVHSAMVRWLAGVTGLKVIKDHQSEKRPDNPYIVVNMLSRARVRNHPSNYEYEEDTAEDVTTSPVMAVEWHFSVHAYGDNPTDILRPIRSAVELPQLQESLHPLMIHDVSSRDNRVPDFINEKWEERAQMDIYVQGYTRDGFVIDMIETFQNNNPVEVTKL